jgi:putative sigma-54 modulation protein
MSPSNATIHVTGRHVSVTDAIRSYAEKKIEGIEIDFPRVIDAHVILDVEKFRHRCEIVLTCTSHIRIEASEESDNMYASIDICIDKLARQLDKYKTKIQRHHREFKSPKNAKGEENSTLPATLDELEKA